MACRRLAYVIAAAMFAAVIVGCTALTATPPNDATRPLHVKSSLGSGAATTNRVGKLHWPAPPPMTIDRNATYTATIATRQGKIEVELLPKDAPIAVNNFVFLAQHHFYRNNSFHRLAKGFVLQGGDPTGTGLGGPGYSIKDEPTKLEYMKGSLIMSRTAIANSGGSQFLIALANIDDILPTHDYAVFGRVKHGMNVVDIIATGTAVKANAQGELSMPVKPVRILDITVQKTP